MSKWEKKTLGELGFVSRGKSRHRPRNASHLYGGPYPLIQTGDVQAADFYITSYSQTYSEEGLAQSKLWPKGTLCISIVGANTAATAILSFDACFPDSVIGFIPFEGVSDVKFVKYSLELLRDHLKGISEGTARENLSLEKLLSVQLSVPDFETQCQIAGTLSAYDDLIENNLRRIHLLEEAARVEYQLLMQEKNETWEVKRLGDVLDFKYGKSLKADTRIEGNYPVFGSSGQVGTHNQAIVNGPGIIVGRKGNVGTVFWSEADFYPIDTVFYVDSVFDLHFLYLNLQTQHFVDGDAAVPGLNRSHALANPIVLPPNNIAEAFSNKIKPMFELQSNITKQNVRLKAARDLLLPRLMSGELAITEEVTLEAVE